MFQQEIFAETRAPVMHALMRAHPLATLVSHMTGGLSADHLPLVLHDDVGTSGVLRGHVAVGNPLWRDAPTGGPVLAVFQGPQAYVTPSWYPSKAEHGKVVPTWNYAVVHAHGSLRFHRDPAWIRAHLEDLTNHAETPRTTPWAVSDAPETFVARQFKGLVGFEIAIERLEGKWKVSQNKSAADRAGVAQGLDTEAQAMAELVAARE